MDQHRPRPLPWVSGVTSVLWGRAGGALGVWAYVKDLGADTRLQAPLTPVFNQHTLSSRHFSSVKDTVQKSSLYAASVLSPGKSNCS